MLVAILLMAIGVYYHCKPLVVILLVLIDGY
jgi:uncharacterized membrane protein